MTRLHCRGAILRRSPGDRKYHRTQRMTITSSKCRPRNSTGRFWLTVLPYQTPPAPFATDPFAMTNAIFDGGIVAWDAKRAFNSVRPVTAIPFLFQGQQIQAW